MVLELMVLSSVAAVASQWARKKMPIEHSAQQSVSRQETTISRELRRSDQRFLAASAALGFSTTGILLRIPICGAASVPLSLFAFAPVLVGAWSTLRDNQKFGVNDQVLVAVRASVCVVMGYSFILALDATLQSTSQCLFLRREDKFRTSLKRAIQQHGLPLSADRLLQPGRQQIYAEQSGERAAPWMFGLFVLTTPLMGINRSAAFLTTTFGAHLRNLGPYTTQDVIDNAMQKGIVLMQPDALERVTLVDTLVVDAYLLERYSHVGFSQRAFERLMLSMGLSKDKALKVYVVFDGDALSCMEKDPLFSGEGVQAIRTSNKTECIEALQTANRKVACIYHVSKGMGEPAAYLNIGYYNAAVADMNNSAQIFLHDGNNVQTLALLFEYANTFVRRQRFNTIVPMGVDVIDISTTIFWDLGLIYSILFTYTGLGLGVLNNHLDERASDIVSIQEEEVDRYTNPTRSSS